jgi:signal transduction histidine kinase
MAAFIIVVLTVAVLATWLAGQATRQEFHGYTTMAGQMQAQRIAPYLADYYRSAGSWDNVEFALTYTPSGMAMRRTEVGRRPAWDMWQMMDAQVLVADAQGRIVADTGGELTGRQLDEASLAVGAPIMVGDTRVGTVLVTTAGLSTAQDDQFLNQVNQAIILAVVVASLVALLLGAVITWGVTRPIRELTRATEAIATGDLSQRVTDSSGDEVGELATAFNLMASQLERAESLRRQLTADIAHELRTPLAVIQGNVEALQDGIFPLTVDALEPIQAKTALLARLVEDLRQLALAEAGQLPLDRQPTDLIDLTQRSVAGFQPVAEAKSIRLEVQGPAELALAMMDAQRIEQVLANLLSNALRFTPEGGAVQVKVSQPGPEWLKVRIRDTGPGIPPEALPNVFERFYRADQSRARDSGQEGTGLGLAVARSIVQAHGGAIGVESQPGHGTSVWFTLPAFSTGG